MLNLWWLLQKMCPMNIRRISHQRNGVSVHEGHQVFVRQGKIGHVCINYANKLKVSTNDLELFAG